MFYLFTKQSTCQLLEERTKFSAMTNDKYQCSYLMWFLYYLKCIATALMKMDAMLTNHDVSHFLKSTLWLKTRFLHQYIKTKIRQQRATNIQVVLSNKRENKSISNPIWKEPLIMISITKYTLSLPGEKQAQKKTTFVLKNKKFFAGLLLFLFISR